MSCNAWNHSYNCDCGWGGNTGGGGLIALALSPDGKDWAKYRTLREETFVNPNAKCPVCGADVFFYGSPAGGKVFFDSLGPPWPKHPCTDTYLNLPTTFRILEPTRQASTRARQPTAPDGWHPLIPIRIHHVGEKDRIRLNRTITHLPSDYLYLPKGFVDDRPCFWRRGVSDPSVVDVSSFSVDRHGKVSEDRIQVPAWIRNNDHLASLQREDGPDAAALNAIGWSLSFSWRTADPGWYAEKDVDIESAKSYFLAAGEQHYWASWNNLGVIARDGFGTQPNPKQAFEYFEKAAQSLRPACLRRLAECYRNGFGVADDPAEAKFLEDLATAIDAEETEMPDPLDHIASDPRLELDTADYRAFTREYDEEISSESLCTKGEFEHLSEQFNSTVYSFARVAPKIFKPPQDLRGSVVTLLIDNSGSMQGKPIFLAASLARLVADELNLRGAAIEILGFTTKAWKGGRTHEHWVTKGKPRNPGRLNELRHIVYHSGSEAWGDDGREKLGIMLREGLLKENIDGEALAWAYKRSLALPGVRRAIILFSDGAPMDDSTLSRNPKDYLERHLRSVIEAIEDHGLVGLGAVGIRYDASRYFKESVSCAELEQIDPQQVISLVAKILLPHST